MIRSFSTLLISLIYLLLAVGTDLFADANTQPKTTIIPSRVVSLVPALTEVVFALNLGSKMVGASSYCYYPVSANDLPKVGSLLDPNWEMILYLEPDLLLLDAADTANQIKAASYDLPVLALDQSSLTGILDGFEILARRLGEGDGGRALQATLQGRLNEARIPQLEDHPRPQVLLVASRVERGGLPSSVWAIGRGSWLSELLEIAGAENVLSQDHATATLSTEGLILLKPDLVIELWPHSPLPLRPMEEWLSDWENLPGWQSTQKATALVGDEMLRPGPRLLEPFCEMQKVLNTLPSRSEP
jgi:iron complex transport system substrate-binding protein